VTPAWLAENDPAWPYYFLNRTAYARATYEQEDDEGSQTQEAG
jgi:hypothetical protein